MEENKKQDNIEKKGYNVRSKSEMLEESKAIRVPRVCNICVYSDAEVRVNFYGYKPPCLFKKDSATCGRWFKFDEEKNIEQKKSPFKKYNTVTESKKT